MRFLPLLQPSPQLVEFRTVNPAPRNYGSEPYKLLKVPHQAHIQPQEQTASSHRPIPCTPNLPQYGLSHRFFGSSLNLSRPIFAVFELPDELILSVLFQISPDTHHTRGWVRFRIHDEMGIDRCRQVRAQILRPLSMTCRAMRLRLVPWIWEYLQLPPPRNQSTRGEIILKKLNIIANALNADTYLATSVRYFYPFSVPRSGLIHAP